MRIPDRTAAVLLGICLSCTYLTGCSSFVSMPSAVESQSFAQDGQYGSLAGDDLQDGSFTDESASGQTDGNSQSATLSSENETAAATAAAQETENIASTEASDASGDQTERQADADRAAIGLDSAGIASLQNAQAGNYYYSLCNDSDKVLYVELYQILQKQAEKIRISTLDMDTLSRVYQCVINDHPELFYLSGYTYTKHSVGGTLKYITFSGKYVYSAKEVETRRAQIEQAAGAILAAIPAGADQYTISKTIYEQLILGTQYSPSAADNQNICSVFLGHASVCNGYAKAAQYLFRKMGIPCLLVNGTAGGDRHAWNMVQLDGQYYHFDATWGDPSYYQNTDSSGKTPDIDYAYLNMSTAQILKNHTIDDKFTVPQCTALTDHYYVREGLYLTSYDEDTVRKILTQAQENGLKYISLEAADQNTYAQMYADLITNQKIFRYYREKGSDGNYTIAYTSNDTLFTLSFWK